MILVMKDCQAYIWSWTTLEEDYTLTMGLMLKTSLAVYRIELKYLYYSLQLEYIFGAGNKTFCSPLLKCNDSWLQYYNHNAVCKFQPQFWSPILNQNIKYCAPCDEHLKRN